MDEVIKVLRSLVISKNGTISVPELLKDFKDNEGYFVNPKTYGFADIKELLVASNQFTFRNCGFTVLFARLFVVQLSIKIFLIVFFFVCFRL